MMNSGCEVTPKIGAYSRMAARLLFVRAARTSADNPRAIIPEGVLVPLPGRAKRNMAYTKPGGVNGELSLLSGTEDNNGE